MGKSRVKRGKEKPQSPMQEAVSRPTNEHTFWPIPPVTGADLAFGKADHLPPYSTIPERFKDWHEPHADFIGDWFFKGRTPEDMARLKARPGVDRDAALLAIKAALASWEPKHEHKTAGCAFLLHEWFELESA